MRGARIRRLLAVLLVGVLTVEPGSAQAEADLNLRVSVKFVLDSGGNRPTSGLLITDGDVLDAMSFANQSVMDPTGRGYAISVSEIVDVAGISQWFNVPVTAANRQALEAAAEADPGLYAWRTSHVNVYVLGSSGGNFNGFCSRTEQAIILDQEASERVFMHELGHYFNLCHTQGCSCSGCATCGGQSDEVDDTILDSACWIDADDIAQGNFGMNFALLPSSQQLSVLQVLNNVMSLHNPPRDILTSDQMDRLTDAANGYRNNVATGRTVFVDVAGSLFGNGSSGNPYVSIGQAANAAASNSIILLNAGSYQENVTISKPLTLRAARGVAGVGAN